MQFLNLRAGIDVWRHPLAQRSVGGLSGGPRRHRSRAGDPPSGPAARDDAGASYSGSRVQASAEARERSRLAALEARIHPHFLFNTLNTVSSLIPTAPARAERLVEQISALLRFALEAPQKGLVPLHQEMKIVTDYLAIEQARFGQRLRFSLDVDDRLRETRVSPLSVQTLVENCVNYAVDASRKGAEIQIRVVSDGDRARIEVADTGQGFSFADLPAGHGLDDLRGRLMVLFGDPDALRVSHRDGWTTVTFACRHDPSVRCRRRAARRRAPFAVLEQSGRVELMVRPRTLLARSPMCRAFIRTCCS